MSSEELQAILLAERRGAYARLRGGWPIPLAGTVYWAALALLGEAGLPLAQWSMIAFLGTGAIFPLALLFATIFRNPFMKDRSAVTSVLVPAFISMLLFWPMIVAAVQEGPNLVPLILAIGLSLHWPVIGWSYGRTAIFSGHAIIRAVGALLLWMYFPEERLTLLPLWVAGVYLATVVVILFDSAMLRRRMSGYSAASAEGVI